MSSCPVGSTSEREQFGVAALQVKMSQQMTYMDFPASTFFIGGNAVVFPLMFAQSLGIW